eukprot:782926-Pleurochrysis_carterae.AAC.2
MAEATAASSMHSEADSLKQTEEQTKGGLMASDKDTLYVAVATTDGEKRHLKRVPKRARLVCEDAQRPDVGFGVVLRAVADLWRQVVRCTALRARHRFRAIQCLGHAKIAEEHLNLHVRALDIAVNNVLRVSVRERGGELPEDAADMHLRDPLARFPMASQKVTQVAARAILHRDAQFVLLHVCAVETDDVRVRQLAQDDHLVPSYLPIALAHNCD